MVPSRKGRRGKMSSGLVGSALLPCYHFPQKKVYPKVNSLSGCQKGSSIFYLLSNETDTQKKTKTNNNLFSRGKNNNEKKSTKKPQQAASPTSLVEDDLACRS